MTAIAAARRSQIGRRLESALYRLRSRLARYRLAYAYARGRMSPDQALSILWDCQHAAGSFCLISLDVSDVLEAARDRWEDHPELPGLCKSAASRVASKWDDYTEVRSSCEDWALDLVADYARGEGIALVEVND